MDVKIGDLVKIDNDQYSFIEESFNTFLKDRKDKWMEVTGFDPKGDNWVRLDDYRHNLNSDNYQFNVKHITEIKRRVKDTKVARAFYKNDIVEVNSGYLFIGVK